MPCKDITEIIDIQWDGDDRLGGYRLNKRTCGAAIGQESLLHGLVAGRTAEEILAISTEDVIRAVPDLADEDTFLYLKHLFALHDAARVLIGEARGDTAQACELVSVGWDDDEVNGISGIRFVGFVSVTEVTRRIKACGGCGSCGASETHA